MSRGISLTMGFLFILSLIFIGALGNKLGDEKERANNSSTNVQQPVSGELASEATFNPPSLENVPDGPQGEAILRGHELVDDTFNQLRGDTASANDGQQRVNELSCSSCHAGAGLEQDSSPLVGVAAKYPSLLHVMAKS
jgi:thiosulfate dehydrogenase